MLCVIHVKHDSEDKQTGYWQFECSSCTRNKIAALRAENEGLVRQTTADAEMLAYRKNEVAAAVRIIQGKDARIAELEAALIAIDLLSSQGFAPALTEIGKIAGAALKGDAE